MSKKYLIFGANGAIGSSLASQLHKDGEDCHLVSKNEDNLIKISDH